MIEKEGKREDLMISNKLYYLNLVVLLTLSLFVLTNFVSYVFAKKGNYKYAVYVMPINAANYVKLADRNLENYRSENDEKLRKEIVSNLSSALILNPQDSMAHEKFGIFLNEMKDPDLIGALREYKHAVRYSPYDPFFRYNLATYFFIRGEYERAKEEYVGTLDVEPYYQKARYGLSQSWWNLGNHEEAKEELNNIISLAKRFIYPERMNSNYERELLRFDFAYVYNSLGKYYWIREDKKKAIYHFEKGLEINPNLAEVYNNLSGIYFKEGDYKKARQLLKSALNIEPDNEIYSKNLERLEDSKK